MKNKHLVTVGITNFNNAPYLRECIDSVLNQTYKHFEIIVVDDASTDGSLDILNSYGNLIKVIKHGQNTGSLVQGRVDVINSAGGQYVAHLDADDFWHPKFLELLISEFEKDSNLDWVVGDTNLVNSAGFVINKWSYADYSTEFEKSIKRGFTTASLPFPTNGIFKVSFLQKNKLTWYRLPNTLQGEDALTSTKYIECRPKLKHVDSYLFNYRLHGSNMSAKPAERIKMIIDLKEYYFNKFDSRILFEDKRLFDFNLESDEFKSLAHLAYAKDLLEIMKNVKIPAAFSNDSTEKELFDNLWRFDKPIQVNCQKSQELSTLFTEESKAILELLRRSIKIIEGRKKLILGDFENAKAEFSQVIKSGHNSAEALCGLGEISYLTGNLVEAEKFTAQAVNMEPRNSRILNNAGVIFEAKNEEQLALKALLGSMNADPHNLDAHLNFTAAMQSFSRNVIISEELKSKLIETLQWLSNNYPDRSREGLLIENWKLAKKTVDEFRGKFADSNLRVLLHLPENGALKYLIESWMEVLNHMGIVTDILGWQEPMAAKFEKFIPNTFISVNEPSYLDTLGRNLVNDWRKYRDLKLGLILDYDNLSSEADFLITFNRQPEKSKQLSKSELPIISVPFGANPLKHFMRPGRAIWDYFFVGTNSAFKKRETEVYLKPVLDRYNGILAGVNWERGVSELSIDQAPLFYSFAKISPNYHVARQIDEYNEINERSFIIPACGGFQIVDNPKAMKDCFHSSEMVVAANPREYQELFRYYLDREDERVDYVRKGMQRVFREHTLFHSLTKFVDFIDKRRDAALTNNTEHFESAGII